MHSNNEYISYIFAALAGICFIKGMAVLTVGKG